MALPKLFERIFWHNNTTPAINEDNLNALSKGLSDVDDRVITLSSKILEVVPYIEDYLAQAEDLVEAMEALSTHPAYIGANGNWWVWSTATSEYVDSGIDASITVEIADITMISYGTTPYITNTGTNTDPVFHLFIPRAATISSVEKTHVSGNVDTYTITMQDGATFTFDVTNGTGSGDMKAVDYDPTDSVVNAGGIPDYADDVVEDTLKSDIIAGLGHSIGTQSTSYPIHVEGVANTVGANAKSAHVEGFHNNADVGTEFAHVEGSSNTVTGGQSGSLAGHAEGYGTTAAATAAHAEGTGTTAAGGSSHAEGENTVVYSGCDDGHAEGANTTVAETAAHAEGFATLAGGEYSHAEGEHTRTIGEASHTEGNGRLSRTIERTTWKKTITIPANTYGVKIASFSLPSIPNETDPSLVMRVFNSSGIPFVVLTGDVTGAPEVRYDDLEYWIDSRPSNNVWDVSLTVSNLTSAAKTLTSISVGMFVTYDDMGAAVGNQSHAEGLGSFAGADESHAEGEFGVTGGKYKNSTNITVFAHGDSEKENIPSFDMLTDKTPMNIFSMDGRGNYFSTGAHSMMNGYIDGVLVANGPEIVLEDGACYLLYVNGRDKRTGAWRGAQTFVVDATYHPLGTGATTTAQGVPHFQTLGTVGTTPVSLSARVEQYDNNGVTAYHSKLGIGSCTTAFGVRWNLIKVLGSEDDFGYASF